MTDTEKNVGGMPYDGSSDSDSKTKEVAASTSTTTEEYVYVKEGKAEGEVEKKTITVATSSAKSMESLLTHRWRFGLGLMVLLLSLEGLGNYAAILGSIGSAFSWVQGLVVSSENDEPEPEEGIGETVMHSEAQGTPTNTELEMSDLAAMQTISEAQISQVRNDQVAMGQRVLDWETQSNDRWIETNIRLGTLEGLVAFPRQSTVIQIDGFEDVSRQLDELTALGRGALSNASLLTQFVRGYSTRWGIDIPDQE